MTLKRITALALMLITLLSLFSCTKGKKSLESSKEELKIVGEIGGTEIPLEIYRYVSMNHKNDFAADGKIVWTGADGEKLLAELNEKTDETVVSLYTVLLIAKEYGIDPYSDEINLQLEATMESMYADYEHDYEKYAEDLSSNYLNDSVLRFLFRNEILSEKIINALVENGTIEEFGDGFADTVLGDTFVRVKNLMVSLSNHDSAEECESIAKTLLAKVNKGEDFDTLVGTYGEDLYMFNNNDGYYVARGYYYEAFEETAFSLEEGETSDIIETPSGFGILMRCPKDEEYINNNLSSLYEIYRDGIYNVTLEAFSNTLSVTWNETKNEYTIFNMENID